MSKRLVIYGAGYPDVVKLVSAINRARESEPWHIAGFIDDTPEKQGTTFMDVPIMGGHDILVEIDKSTTWFFNNVFATTAARASIAHRLGECRLATLIHPSVDVSFAQVGNGTIIGAGVSLGANVSIGDHCAVRYNSVVNHDNLIEDCVFIGPGVTLSGYVTVRTGAYIGAGSTVKQHVEVGGNCLIGAGSVVVDNVAKDSCVAGVPAREMCRPRDTFTQRVPHSI